MNDYTFYEELVNLIQKYQDSKCNMLGLPKDIKAHRLASFILKSLEALIEVRK